MKKTLLVAAALAALLPISGFAADGTSTNAADHVVVNGFENNYTETENTVIIGSHNEAIGSWYDRVNRTIIIGDNRSTLGSSNVLIGGSNDNSTYIYTPSKEVTAVGNRANGNYDFSVAIGSNSIADRDAGVAGWDPATNGSSTNTDKAWTATRAAMSIGSDTITRQITNLAAGTEDTDAMNVTFAGTIGNGSPMLTAGVSFRIGHTAPHLTRTELEAEVAELSDKVAALEAEMGRK